MSGPSGTVLNTTPAPVFDSVRVLPDSGHAYWTVVDPAREVVDSADGYLRFLRLELEAEELTTKQYARNLAYFFSWVAGLNLDLWSVGTILQSFAGSLRSNPALDGDDFLLRRPERVDQMLATVRGFYVHLVTCRELPREALGSLHEVATLSDGAVRSYAQNGEDLQIAHYVGKRERVTYVDVGCLWPKQFSNSYFFYERGGHGLCIDANPTVAEEYETARPRDVFLNCGVAATRGTMTYYMHESPVFNTFCAEHAAELADRVTGMKDSPQRQARTLVGTVDVPTMTLDEAVRSTGFAARCDGRVDFLSIDVEGLELEVLSGFGFQELRPRVVILEDFRRGAEARRLDEESPIVEVLKAHRYRLAGRSGVNLCFLDEDR
jgi:FkbM family methyltransferase